MGRNSDDKALNDDFVPLSPEDKLKWEIAREIGVFDKVADNGWKSLSAKESGRIGGILSSRRKALQKRNVDAED